jgi:hypothetical protein
VISRDDGVCEIARNGRDLLPGRHRRHHPALWVVDSYDHDVAVESELDRLRSLVGPSEAEYLALRRDVVEAERVAREAMTEVGSLRGRIAELETMLARSRQDQDFLQQRVELTAWEGLMYRGKRRWDTSVVPRMKRLVD